MVHPLFRPRRAVIFFDASAGILALFYVLDKFGAAFNFLVFQLLVFAVLRKIC
jgi:hypothetical protein